MRYQYFDSEDFVNPIKSELWEYLDQVSDTYYRYDIFIKLNNLTLYDSLLSPFVGVQKYVYYSYSGSTWVNGDNGSGSGIGFKI